MKSQDRKTGKKKKAGYRAQISNEQEVDLKTRMETIEMTRMRKD